MKTIQNAGDLARFITTERADLATRVTLTEKQRECLRLLQRGPRSLWDFGSTTISGLRAAGYITTTGGFAQLTERGHCAINAST